MSEWKRLFYYLLLNIVVSAATTFAVLMFWEKAHLSEISFTQAFFSSQEENQPTIVLPTLASPVVKMTQPITPAGVGAEKQTSRSSQPIPVLAATSSNSTVVIEAVIGAGDLANEKVRIKHTGNGEELSLANWRLVGKGGVVYTFPQLTLHKGGAVDVYTMKGADTVIALYWGRDQAVWQSGSVVKLLDAENREQASYVVP